MYRQKRCVADWKNAVVDTKDMEKDTVVMVRLKQNEQQQQKNHFLKNKKKLKKQ